MCGFALGQGFEVDAVSAVDAGLGSRPDPEILEWAAQNERVVVTLDVSTMIGYARDRVRDGRPTAGLLVLRKGLESRVWIENSTMMAVCYDPPDMADQIRFIPKSPREGESIRPRGRPDRPG